MKEKDTKIRNRRLLQVELRVAIEESAKALEALEEISDASLSEVQELIGSLKARVSLAHVACQNRAAMKVSESDFDTLMEYLRGNSSRYLESAEEKDEFEELNETLPTSFRNSTKEI